MNSEIQKKQKSIDVFVVDDHEFATAEEAENYIAERDKYLQYTYYTVVSDFDGSEGRGYQTVSYVAIPGASEKPMYKLSKVVEGIHRHIEEDGCFDYYGQMFEAWKISRQEVFENMSALKSSMRQWSQKRGLMKFDQVFFLDDSTELVQVATLQEMLNA